MTRDPVAGLCVTGAGAGGLSVAIATSAPQVDPLALRAHLRGVIAGIAPHDSQERLGGLGVTVLREQVRMRDAGSVDAGGTCVRARRFVVATGSRPCHV